jgi:polysaccharide export outer membrane protein
MRNKDVIYASNSLSVESSKFMNYLRLIVGTAQDPVAAATSVYILGNTIASATSAIAVTTGSTVGVPIVSP